MTKKLVAQSADKECSLKTKENEKREETCLALPLKEVDLEVRAVPGQRRK